MTTKQLAELNATFTTVHPINGVKHVTRFAVMPYGGAWVETGADEFSKVADSGHVYDVSDLQTLIWEEYKQKNQMAY